MRLIAAVSSRGGCSQNAAKKAEHKAKAAKDAGALTPPYDVEADIEGYYKVFSEFDKDCGGSVDHSEMKEMIESLGMSIKKDTLDAMIKEADTDGSGEIEFGEFVEVMRKAAGMFAAMISRQKNAIKMAFRTDRKGDAITIEGSTASHKGEGWGVALLDKWMPGDEKLNKGSALLEINAPSGMLWVGLVGRNFNPEGDWWNKEFTDMKNEKKGLCCAVRSTDGRIYRHGADLTDTNGLKAGKFGEAKRLRVQIDIDAGDKEMTFKVLDETNDYEEAASATIDELKAEVAVAICFGPTTGDATTVRLVGSSCEASAKKNRRASKDLWDDDNVAGLADKVQGGVGLNELNGA